MKVDSSFASYVRLHIIQCEQIVLTVNLWPVKGGILVLTKPMPFLRINDIQCTIVFVFDFYNNKTAAVKIN